MHWIALRAVAATGSVKTPSVNFYVTLHKLTSGLTSNELQSLLYRAFFVDIIKLRQFKIVFTQASHKAV